jgi:HlyD family secretion protein
MKTFFITSYTKLRTWVGSHIIISIIIVLVAAFGLYKVVQALTTTTGETRYVLTTAQKGTIISTVSGSGQIEASSTVNITARSSSTITSVPVKAGQTVTRGQLLVSLDARDAQKSIRDAKANVANAQLALDKLSEVPDTADVLSLKSAITDAENSKTDAQKSVDKAYTALLNSSTAASPSDNTNTQTPPTILGTYTGTTEGQLVITVRNGGTGSAYFTYSGVPASLGTGSGDVTTTTPTALGNTGLYIKFPSTTSSNQPDWIITLPNKSASNYQSNYIAYQDAISNQSKTNASAETTIAVNQDKLAKLYTPDALDLQTKQLSLTQAQDSLLDAQENLGDYYITAPGTLITDQKVASISLNEVDVAKIKLGDKATLTFDAVDNLTISGIVAEIDTVGTTSQGVVSYAVKISLDTDDDRVKPGMSVSADIITDMKTDVLTVPASAVKSTGGTSYVLTFTPALATTSADTQGVASKTAPGRTIVTTGLSDDTSTEITSGLKEGDQIVSRSITVAATTTASTAKSATSLLGGSGGTRTGGAGFGGAPR